MSFILRLLSHNVFHNYVFRLVFPLQKDDASGQQSHFFNIYSDWDLNSDSALDVVSQSCLPLELDFVPYHLYHTKTKGKKGWEVSLVEGFFQQYAISRATKMDRPRERKRNPLFYHPDSVVAEWEWLLHPFLPLGWRDAQLPRGGLRRVFPWIRQPEGHHALDGRTVLARQ